MRSRLVAAILLVLGSLTAAGVTYGFNDKGAIIHNGHVICVDWRGWTQHQLHGDQPSGPYPYTCDVP